MKKNLINKICKVTEKQFNAIIKKLNINMVTLTMKQKDDIKEDDKIKIDIKKNKCD